MAKALRCKTRPMDQFAAPEPNTEAFANAPVNPVKVTAEEPVSTFSIDVDTASYAVVRSSLNAGQLAPARRGADRGDGELFPLRLSRARGGRAPFPNTVTVMPTPWNPGTRLVHIALQGALPHDRTPAAEPGVPDRHLGSMEDANKLPLLKQSLSLMLAKLRPEDQVAIVTYAGSAGRGSAPHPGR